MYIVQITAARKNPVDDGLDEVTYPAFTTPNLLKAIGFAQGIDGTNETFSAGKDQGVRVYFTGPAVPYVGKEASERAIFVRRPYADTLSADGLIWNERWLQESYELRYREMVVARDSAIPGAAADTAV